MDRPLMLCPAQLTVPLQIRRGQASDLRPLEWGDLYSHDRAIIEAAYQKQLQGTCELLVGELTGPAGGLPAGFVAAQLWIDVGHRAEQGIGVLWAFRVFPALCGQGIGTRLLEEAEARLRQRGFQAAEIGVEPTNGAARRLYERQGYRLLGEVPYAGATDTHEGGSVYVTSRHCLLRKPL